MLSADVDTASVIEDFIYKKSHTSAYQFVEDCLLSYYDKWCDGMSQQIEGFDNGKLTLIVGKKGITQIVSCGVRDCDNLSHIANDE